MNELQIFNNPEFGEIRTFMEQDGSVSFCGTDSATALGYANTRDALIRHCKKDGVANHDVIDSMGRKQKAKFISEGNLYRLITHSELPGADKFESWIFDDVLPSIRKTGSYSVQQTTSKLPKIRTDPAVSAKRVQVMELSARTHAASQMLRLWSDAGVKPEYQALAMQGYYPGLSLPREALSGQATALLDATTVAKNLGILSKSGEPHVQAVTAIIKKIGLLSADEYAMTPYSKNGHDGTAIQYTAGVERKVENWLEANGFPATISDGVKNFSVRYGG